MKLLYQYNLKILALISAIILWFIVITVENNVVKYPEPIQVKEIGLGDYYALSEPLPEVTLYLKIDPAELKTISDSDIDVYVDLSDIAEGTHTVDIMATLDGSKSKVLKVEPATTTIAISAVLKKEVPLNVSLSGKPNEEFKVTKTTVTPENVEISGAKAVLDQIDQVDVPFQFTGTETKSFETDITLKLENLPDEPLVQIEPEIVKLNIELETKNETKQVTITPNFIRQADRDTFGSKLTIEPSTITITGATELIDSIDSVKTQPIEVSLLLRNESVSTKLELPEGISLADPTQKVMLTIQ